MLLAIPNHRHIGAIGRGQQDLPDAGLVAVGRDFPREVVPAEVMVRPELLGRIGGKGIERNGPKIRDFPYCLRVDPKLSNCLLPGLLFLGAVLSLPHPHQPIVEPEDQVPPGWGTVEADLCPVAALGKGGDAGDALNFGECDLLAEGPGAGGTEPGRARGTGVLTGREGVGDEGGRCGLLRPQPAPPAYRGGCLYAGAERRSSGTPEDAGCGRHRAILR